MQSCGAVSLSAAASSEPSAAASRASEAAARSVVVGGGGGGGASGASGGDEEDEKMAAGKASGTASEEDSASASASVSPATLTAPERESLASIDRSHPTLPTLHHPQRKKLRASKNKMYPRFCVAELIPSRPSLFSRSLSPPLAVYVSLPPSLSLRVCVFVFSPAALCLDSRGSSAETAPPGRGPC